MWTRFTIFWSYCYFIGNLSAGHLSKTPQVSLSSCSTRWKISFCWHNYPYVFQAHVFSSGPVCAAFLSNSNPKSAARVTFRSRHYNLPPWSISILPDCKNEVFNTAKVHKVFKYSVPLSNSYKSCLNILKQICCITGPSFQCTASMILFYGAGRKGAPFVSGNALISPQRLIHQRILSFNLLTVLYSLCLGESSYLTDPNVIK